MTLVLMVKQLLIMEMFYTMKLISTVNLKLLENWLDSVNKEKLKINWKI